MIFCNLVVIKINLRPSERQEQRLPNLRKALDVVCHIYEASNNINIVVFKLLDFWTKG